MSIPNGTRSDSTALPLLDLSVHLGGLYIAVELWLGFFLGGNCDFDFSTLGPYLKGQLVVPKSPL